jgi:heat shock protein HslJ
LTLEGDGVVLVYQLIDSTGDRNRMETRSVQRTMRRTLVLIAAFGLTLAACGDPSEEASADPTEVAWVLESGTLNGEPFPVLDDHPITLVFDEGSVGGDSACNSYFGDYTMSGNEIAFSDLGQTMMACEPAEVMESEGKYHEALGLVETFSATADTLTLTGDGVELIFVVDESA